MIAFFSAYGTNEIKFNPDCPPWFECPMMISKIIVVSMNFACLKWIIMTYGVPRTTDEHNPKALGDL